MNQIPIFSNQQACNGLFDCADHTDEFCKNKQTDKHSVVWHARLLKLQEHFNNDDIGNVNRSENIDDNVVRLFHNSVGMNVYFQKNSMKYDLLSNAECDNTIGCVRQSMFYCASSFHIPIYLRCNDVIDCPGAEDEAGCEVYTCPVYYRCYKSQVCLAKLKICFISNANSFMIK